MNLRSDLEDALKAASRLKSRALERLRTSSDPDVMQQAFAELAWLRGVKRWRIDAYRKETARSAERAKRLAEQQRAAEARKTMSPEQRGEERLRRMQALAASIDSLREQERSLKDSR
ncbi:hypothetical protein [Devosia sp.]|uniref:hypothetical protein n=1 Tax=Devosia sp. TaxID=1871048 RepID=UPI00292DDEB1|nr:hypothetical protein [Devosia sp.]